MSTVKQYLGTIDTVLGARRGMARVATVLGADAPAAPAPTATALVSTEESATTKFLRGIGATRDVKSYGVVTVGAAAVGAVVGQRFGHPVLGAIGSASLARNVPALFRAGEQKLALRNLATTGAGILGATLVGGGSSLMSLAGFLAGSIVGGLAAYWGGWRDV